MQQIERFLRLDTFFKYIHDRSSVDQPREIIRMPFPLSGLQLSRDTLHADHHQNRIDDSYDGGRPVKHQNRSQHHNNIQSHQCHGISLTTLMVDPDHDHKGQILGSVDNTVDIIILKHLTENGNGRAASHSTKGL